MVCDFNTQFYANLLYNLVNRNTSKTGVNKCLNLIAFYIEPAHLGKACNHTHLYIQNATYVSGNCDGKRNKSSKPYYKARGGTLNNLIVYE